MSHHLRRARGDDLPKVRDLATDEMRPARPEEMIRFGAVAIGDDLYDVAHVDGTPEPEWGVRVIEGPPAVRYDSLPPSVRRKVSTGHRWRGEP